MHVVVSCKSRKSAPVPTALHMSSIAGVALEERVGQWTSALKAVDVPAVRAGDLYAGDHWKIVLGIPAAATGAFNVQLWVASAGYGLVGIDTPLKPYSATF